MTCLIIFGHPPLVLWTMANTSIDQKYADDTAVMTAAAAATRLRPRLCTTRRRLRPHAVRPREPALFFYGGGRSGGQASSPARPSARPRVLQMWTSPTLSANIISDEIFLASFLKYHGDAGGRRLTIF